jgi:hypothetical protein
VPRRYALILGACTLLFIARVVGQWLVASFDVSWLPPMAHWYSGLLPYPILLPVQLAITLLMLYIVRDFGRGYGYFVLPHPRAGRYIRWFSYAYFLAMVLRYVLTMWLYPERRWLPARSRSGFTWCWPYFSIPTAAITRPAAPYSEAQVIDLTATRRQVQITRQPAPAYR